MKLQELEARLAESEARRQELEAARLELVEENRELDEQNRELEEDNTRLRERLRKGEPAPLFPGSTRRAQGLAALMGQRPAAEPARQQPDPEQSESASSEPAKSDAVNAEPAATPEARTAPPAVQGERQGHLAIEQAPSADGLLKQWYQRYPRTFFKGHTRPLKVGIHHDLAAREPWPEKLVRRALAGYVNLPRYLKAVREEAERIDLDGAPAGIVDAQAAEHARRKLERLQSERRESGRKENGRNEIGRKEGGRKEGGRRTDTAPQRSADKTQAHGSANRPGQREQNAEQKPERKPRPMTGAAESSATQAAATPSDPKERMEAKLSALLAKHGSGKTGP
ncbi:MAG: hypothetical protein JJU25_16315 [Halomonas sp.]|nr:hypothetical protein [Halomonas sp.]